MIINFYFCGTCSLPLETSLIWCGRCKKIAYCSEDCLKTAEKVHLLFCETIRLSKETLYAALKLDLEEKVALYEDPKTDLVRHLTQKEFFELTSSYCLGTICFKKDLCNEWIPKVIPSISHSIALFKTEKTGIGVKALQFIPSGTSFASFGGVCYPEKRAIGKCFYNAIYKDKGLCYESPDRYKDNFLVTKRYSEYSAFLASKFYNTEVFLNLGALINDGPENCQVRKSKKSDDLELVALQDIQKGEHLSWCYGKDHAVRQGIYSIDDDHYKKIQKKCGDGYLLTLLENDARLSAYVLQTPTILFRLLLDGTLLFENINVLLTDCYIPDFIQLQLKTSSAEFINGCKKMKEVKSSMLLLDQMTPDSFITIAKFVGKISIANELLDSMIGELLIAGKLLDDLKTYIKARPFRLGPQLLDEEKWIRKKWPTKKDFFDEFTKSIEMIKNESIYYFVLSFFFNSKSGIPARQKRYEEIQELYEIIQK